MKKQIILDFDEYKRLLKELEDINKFIDFILSLREIENEELQDKIDYFNKNIRRMWC